MIKDKQNNLSLILGIFTVLFLLVQVPDLIGTSDFVVRHIGVTSNTIIFSYIILLGTIRVVTRKQLFSDDVSKILRLLFFIIFGLSVIMTAFDHVMHVNYIYSLTRVNYDQLGFLSFAFGLLWAINCSNKFFSDHKKYIIFCTPILLATAFFLMYLWPFEVLKRALHEDGPVEYLQCIFPLLSVGFALYSAKMLKNVKAYLLAGLYGVVALGLFFIAGEEISWGQRIFDIATPDGLREINRQGETTIHNIASIESNFLRVQILVNIFGVLSPLIIPVARRFFDKKMVVMLFPQWYYVLFFAPTVLYHVTTLKEVIPYIPEAIELFFYLGVLVFMIERYLSNPYRESKKSKKNTR